ncbi:MAG: hypothetical protein IPJ71_19615 [Bdellovibrionales bacterium]|nr:hypothetical protein [Bdellovibrionales bacterium]
MTLRSIEQIARQAGYATLIVEGVDNANQWTFYEARMRYSRHPRDSNVMRSYFVEPETELEKLSMNIREEREFPGMTTGVAIPRFRFSPRNQAKEKFYPKGCAFLQKSGPFLKKWPEIALLIVLAHHHDR